MTPTLKILPDAARTWLVKWLSRIVGILYLTLATLITLALYSYNSHDASFNTATKAATTNLLSDPGAYGADMLLQLFGLASFTLTLILVIRGIGRIRVVSQSRWIMAILSAILLPWMSFYLSLWPNPRWWPMAAGMGGACGDILASHFLALTHLSPTRFGWLMLMPTLTFILILCWYGFGLTSQHFWQIYQIISRLYQSITADNATAPMLVEAPTTKETIKVKLEKNKVPEPNNTDAHPLEDTTSAIDTSNLVIHAPEVKEEKAQRPRPRLVNTEFALPDLDLIEKPKVSGQPMLRTEMIEDMAAQLQTVLEEFGVRGEITDAMPGPVVTLFELKPAAGIKTARVVGLADDIARSMCAVSARVAVVPGRNVIGIELPNPKRETVYLRDLLQSKVYGEANASLPLILGKDISGAAVIADLARMPHLLVAGTTGSGKSVAVNTMILSLLYRMTPDQCRFIMIDPKMLELSIYEGIPHLLTPVVTEPKKAVVALKWAVKEMENRYRLMAKLGVRNIEGYNTRIREAKSSGELLMRRVQTGFDPDSGKPIFESQPLATDPLPFIVVVVDEMADLMLVAGKEIEAAVQRLAQMARAAGIHLIMATQRPSVDVITGTIKANFPTRISFQVTSKIDSRTILGEQGAEQLLGQGDMLHMQGGGRITRVHGAFCKDMDVERVVEHLRQQGEPTYVEDVTEDPTENLTESSEDQGDTLYHQAVDLVIREGKASTSFIQRHLQIGYNRAARIIEIMEKQGVVSAANHVGKREVLGRGTG